MPDVDDPSLRDVNAGGVLVTGSDGFVGRHLVLYLAKPGYKVSAASREATAFKLPNVREPIDREKFGGGPSRGYGGP